MSNFSSYPRQDAFETTLATDIDAVVTTIGLNLAPSFTLSSGTCYAVIDYDKPTTKIEIISFSGVSGSNLTGVTRGVAKYEGGATTAQTHASGAKVIISDNWQTWKDIATAINSKIDTSGGTITGGIDFSGASATFRTPNLTTAEKTALASPASGMLVFDTTLGELQQYNGGTWVTFAAGSTQPNASTTVAGKVQMATSADITSGTSTGSTGAPLAVDPSLVQPLLTPAGVIAPFAGYTAPTGWLKTDGSAVSRATYSSLFNVIAPSKGTITLTIATPSVLTLNSHGLQIGDSFYLTTTGALPTGVTANTLYYVISASYGTNSFQFSAARGGAAVNTSGTQSGTHTLVFCPFGLGDGSTTFNLPNLNGKLPIGFVSSDTDFGYMGQTAGAKTAAHTHPLGDAGQAQLSTGASVAYARSVATSTFTSTIQYNTLSSSTPGNTASTGLALAGATNSATPSILNPYLTMQFIIKT